MPIPALLRYDLWLAWRHLRRSFNKPGDVGIVLVGIPFLLAILVKATENSIDKLLQMSAPILGAVAFAITLMSADAAALRLAWHKTSSVMAPQAHAKAAIAYLIALLTPVFVLCAWTCLLLLSSDAVAHAAWVVSGFFLGLSLATVPRRILGYCQTVLWRFSCRHGHRGHTRDDAPSRHMRIFDFVAGRSFPAGGTFIKLMLLLGVLGLILAVGFGVATSIDRRSGASVDIVVFATVLVLIRLALQKPSLFRYLHGSGIHPMRVVIAQIMLAGVFVMSTSIGMAFFWPVPVEPIVAGAAVLLIFVWFSIFSAYNYAIKSRLAANAALQVEIIVLALVAWVALPAVAVLIGCRAFLLERTVRLSLWKAD